MTLHNLTLDPKNVKKYGLFKSGWEQVIASRLEGLSPTQLLTKADPSWNLHAWPLYRQKLNFEFNSGP